MLARPVRAWNDPRVLVGVSSRVLHGVATRAASIMAEAAGPPCTPAVSPFHPMPATISAGRAAAQTAGSRGRSCRVRLNRAFTPAAPSTSSGRLAYSNTRRSPNVAGT
jgi:hypothetical protein